MAKHRLVVIDDNLDTHKLLRNYILESSSDFEIIDINHSKEAIKILQENLPISLILLDIMMPEIDGFTLIQMIKANPAMKDIPVVFLSAKSDLIDKLQALQHGAKDYITKPFRLSDLMERIQNIIGSEA